MVIKRFGYRFDYGPANGNGNQRISSNHFVSRATILADAARKAAKAGRTRNGAVERAMSVVGLSRHVVQRRVSVAFGSKADSRNVQLVSSPTRCPDGTHSAASRRLQERMPRRAPSYCHAALGQPPQKNNKRFPWGPVRAELTSVDLLGVLADQG
jgi:hypothetical protein